MRSPGSKAPHSVLSPSRSVPHHLWWGLCRFLRSGVTGRQDESIDYQRNVRKRFYLTHQRCIKAGLVGGPGEGIGLSFGNRDKEPARRLRVEKHMLEILIDPRLKAHLSLQEFSVVIGAAG